MDVVYNQHSTHAKRNNRSFTNFNHLSLAPLTSKLPLAEAEYLEAPVHTSYIEGRSAPTTPSILSRSSSRNSVPRATKTGLPKSKSSINLVTVKRPCSAAATPGPSPLRKGAANDDLQLTPFSETERDDSDWLLRAGALMANSARESKGQAWLVSRASSTSLSAQRDEVDQLEQGILKEKEQASRRSSRRGSTAGAFDADDEFSPLTTRGSMIFGQGDVASDSQKGHGSRASSRSRSKPRLFIPDREAYFDEAMDRQNIPTEPDFVSAEEEDEDYEEEENAKQDEAVVMKLTRASGSGFRAWVEYMLGWSFFAEDEDGEDTGAESFDELAGQTEKFFQFSRRNYHEIPSPPEHDTLPQPDAEEAGGWQDAAWLLSVATKVLL